MTRPPGRPGHDAERDAALRASLRPADELAERRPRRRQVEVEGVEESLRPVVDQAVADLVARLGVAPAQVRVEAAGAVTWSDGSCGCPEPGRAYPQVPVDGVYVRLAARGRLFHFHGGGRRGLFLCDA
ncbi:MAG: hypothetical protein ACJ715_08510 [Ornithinibacter sp.]